MTKKLLALFLVLVMVLSFAACGNSETPDTSIPTESTPSTSESTPDTTAPTETEDSTTPSETTPGPTTDPTIKDPNNVTVENLSHELFNGTDAYVIVNNGVPFFTDEEKVAKSFEKYSELDSLGRCGVTYACVGKDLMPTEDRESISSVYPSGWKYSGKSNNNQYDFVDGKYLYNRCHLIGFQLTGENANKQNLITGTRFLNINGMLTFENMIADAVKEDDLHVLYRVTPIYKGNNLLPEGVLMEGYSIEDEGETIEFCMFAFNVQPGVDINYATGENALATDNPSNETTTPDDTQPADTQTYVLNTNTKKFHKEDCASAQKISDANKDTKTCTRESLIDEGYAPCGVCKP